MNLPTFLAKLSVRPLHIGTITFSLEYRRCGKCRRCPHGPYLYARQKGQHRRYIGSAARLTEKDLKILLRTSAITLP